MSLKTADNAQMDAKKWKIETQPMLLHVFKLFADSASALLLKIPQLVHKGSLKIYAYDMPTIETMVSMEL